MKKLLMSLALLGTFAAMSAKGDSYIYWMAQTDNSIYSVADSASLMAQYNGGEAVDIGYAQFSGLKTAERVPSDNLVFSLPSLNSAIGTADAANWTFYVELWSGDWNMGTSEGMSYAQLQGWDAIYKSTLQGGLGTAKFTNFTYNIPEPTSGLLILLGMCGLVLKRKRV